MDIQRFLPWRKKKANKQNNEVAKREDPSPSTRPMHDGSGFPSLMPFGSVFGPRFEMSQTDDAYVVRAQLPGMSEKDVSITTYNGVLTIQGEARHEREDRSPGRHFIARSHGVFHRSLPLPADAAEDGVEARFKDGVLTVQVPRSRETRPGARWIEVRAG